MRPHLFFLSIAGFAAATSASAQLNPEKQTGSLMAAKPHSVDSEDAAVIRKNFAKCVYYAATPKVLALLAHSDIQSVDTRSAGIKNIVRDLKLETCLGNEVGFFENALGLRITAPTLRDMLAEEAYLARNRTAPEIPMNAGPLDVRFVSAGIQLASAQALTAFTDCTVRRNPAGADALLRTSSGSDGERQAATALAPDMGACLVAGQQLSFKPANVRALMAFAMWSRFGRTDEGHLEAVK